METLTQEKVTLDGTSIIQDVLWQDGVRLSITVFSAQVTAESSQSLTDYFPPQK